MDKIDFDRVYVKDFNEWMAYAIGKAFFLMREEYTHLVIWPDDLVYDDIGFRQLLLDVEEYELSNLAGTASLNEDMTPNISCTKQKGADLFAQSHGSWYQFEKTDKDRKNTLVLPDEIFEVGFTGFCCQILERDLVRKLSFIGACNENKGCMDSRMSMDMKELGIPLLVQPTIRFTHLRNRQLSEVLAVKSGIKKGYVKFVPRGVEFDRA